MRPALILIAGPAGAGKTYVGRALARALPEAVLLDKDTLATALVESLLVRLGRPPTDRESAVYHEHVRPLEYAALMAMAHELLLTDRIALTAAPFARELEDADWIAQLRAKVRQGGAGFGIIWVEADPKTTRERIRARSEARDAHKMARWDEYLERTRFHAPPVRPLHVFHNDHLADPGSFDRDLRAAIVFVRERTLDRTG